jgi:hypothetical protein
MATEAFPPPLPSDSENVSWLLSTAQSLFAKGEREDAVRWLRRAAEAARDEDDGARADALTRAAVALENAAAKRDYLETLTSATPAPAPPKKPTALPAPPRQPASAAGAESMVIPSADLSWSDPAVDVPASPPTTDDDIPDALPTQRFDYGGVDLKFAVPTHEISATAATELPPVSLSAIRVWVIPDKSGFRVAAAQGQRPAAAVDAVLTSASPGVDLVTMLTRRS